MRSLTGLYNYVIADDLGLAAAWSPESGALLFFTVEGGRWLKAIR